MATVSVQRRTSSIVYSKQPSKIYENNRRYLKVELPEAGGANRTRTYINWAIPSVVRQSGAVIESATVTFYPAFTQANVEFRAGFVTSGWKAGKTLAWNKQPSFDLSNYSSVKTPSGFKRGQPVRMDVLTQARRWQSGAAQHGLIFYTNTVKATGFEIANYGQYVPVLTLEYYLPPTTPKNLTPTSNQAVDTPQPLLTVRDVNTDMTPVNAVEVELYDDGSRVWQSGIVETEVPQLDLSKFSDVPDHPEGASRSWRIRLRGVGNRWSPWSEMSPYKYVPLGTTTITVPEEGDEVTDSSPTVLWENDFTQKQFRLRYVDPSAAASKQVLWDSGLRSGGDTSLTVTKALPMKPGSSYRVVLHTYDNITRAAGSQLFVTATRNFVYELSSGVPPVTNFVLTDLDPLPFAKFTWDRDNIPDGWEFVRDGEVVATAIGTDWLVEGSTTQYEFTDWEAAPRREHVWSVRAVENGAASRANPQIQQTINPGAIWLSDPDSDIFLPLLTLDNQDINLSEVGATHYPVNGQYPVRVTSALRRYSGQISAELYATVLTGSLTGAQLRDQFLELRENTGRRLILTANDDLWPVVAYDMNVSPTPQLGRDGDYLYSVQFSFVEVP